MRRFLAWALVLLLMAGSTGGASAKAPAGPDGDPGERGAGPRYGPTPDGLWWSGVMRITSNSGDDRLPRLAVSPNGTTGVAWCIGDRYMWKKLDISGYELKAERAVANGSYPVQFCRYIPPAIGVDSKGAYHICYKDGDYGVFYSKLDGNGSELVAKKSVPSGASWPHAPSIAVASNDIVHLTYEDARFGAGNEAISYARLLNDGTVDKDGVRVSDAEHRCSGSTSCTDPLGNIHVVYVNASLDVYHVKLDNSGNKIGAAPPTLLFRAEGEYEQVGPASVCADGGGNVHLAWNTGSAGEGRLMYMKLDRNGNKLAAGPGGKGIPLMSANTTVGYPAIAADGRGTATVVWSDIRNGSPRLWYLRIDNGRENDTDLPNRAILLNKNEPTGRDVEPDVATDAQGNLHVVWANDQYGQNDLYYQFAYAGSLMLSLDAGDAFNLTWAHRNETRRGNFTLTNCAGFNDTFHLSIAVDSHRHGGWCASLEASEVALDGLESRTLQVSVTGPPAGNANDFIDTTILATSEMSPQSNDTLSFRTYLVVDQRVALSCDRREQTTAAGERANYTMVLRNNGDALDGFGLEAEGPPGWSWEVWPGACELGPGRSTNVTLAVTPPALAAGGDAGSVKVTAFLVQNRKVQSMVATRTFVAVWHSLEVTADGAKILVPPGGTARAEISVWHGGNTRGRAPVLVDESHRGPGWAVSLDTRTLLLLSDESAPVILEAAAPPGAPAGAEMQVLVTASIENASASCNVTFVVSRSRAINIDNEPGVAISDPGGTAGFIINLENAGNAPETLRPGRMEPPPGWSLSFGRPDGTPFGDGWSVPLGAGAVSSVTAYVRIPEDAPAGEGAVRGEFLDESGAGHGFSLAVRVRQYFGAALDPASPRLGGASGQTLIFQIRLRNTGNGMDTFALEVSGGPKGWEAPEVKDGGGERVGQVKLGPNATAALSVVVRLPNRPVVDAAAIRLLARSAGGPADATELLVVVDRSELLVSALELDPARPREGRAATVNVTVENRGSATARNVTLELHRTGEYPVSRELGDIAAGGRRVESFSWVPRAGKNVLLFIVDPDDTVFERNESDNTAMLVRSFGGGPAAPAGLSWVAAAAAAPVAMAAGLAAWRRAGRRGGP